VKNCPRNDKGFPEDARRPVIVWHGKKHQGGHGGVTYCMGA